MSASLIAFAVVCSALCVIAVAATLIAVIRDGYGSVPTAEIRRPLGD